MPIYEPYPPSKSKAGYSGTDVREKTFEKRNELLSRIDGANSQEELAEAELDVFHAKMNRYLYEAAHETRPKQISKSTRP